MGTRVESIKTIEITKDREGNILEEKEHNRTKEIVRLTEPEYIKLYIKPWDRAWALPGEKPLSANYRLLFTVLAVRMSYCENDDWEHSQLVQTGGPYAKEILEALGWKHRDSLQKGLKALCGCEAIRKVSRGLYQINPAFAGKGQWKYNPRHAQSNLEEFKKYFNQQLEDAAQETG